MVPQALTRVAIVSDDRLLSDGLMQFLSERSDFSVTTRYPCAPWAVSPIDGEDIVVMDVRAERAWQFGGTFPSGKVILMGAPEDDNWATDALGSGARGILTRTASRDDLVHAIHVVRDGGIWARRRWLNACVMQLVDASKHRVATQDSLDTRLSRREREVLEHAATGVGNKELADRLSISEATVKVHLTHIFQKLGVPGRAALAAAYHHVGAIGYTADTTVVPTNGVLR